MRNIVIENYGELELDDRIKTILQDNFTENREYWFYFHDAFWPENRETTLAKFKSLEEGDNIIIQTTFVDWMQLELMAELLEKIEVRLNIHLVVFNLKYVLSEYLTCYRSDITPEECYDSWEKQKEFKARMNQKVINATERHNIWQTISRRLPPVLIKFTEEEKADPSLVKSEF